MTFRRSLTLATLLGPAAFLAPSALSAQTAQTPAAPPRTLIAYDRSQPIADSTAPARDSSASSSSTAAAAAASPSAAWASGISAVRPVASPAEIRHTPTFGQTFNNYVKESLSFRNVIDAGLLAGMPRIANAPAQPMAPSVLNSTTGPAYESAMTNYGNSMDAWRRNSEVELRYQARRAGVGIATEETRSFLGDLVLPLALREDGRYVSADLSENFGSRVGHAFAAPFVARTPGGRLIPNFAHLGATFAAGAIGQHFYAAAFDAPELRTNSFLLKYTAFSLAGDVATNVGRELVRSAIKSDLQQFQREGESTEAHYYPLSAAGKVANWARSTYSPRHFVSAALLAGMPQFSSQPTQPAAPPINTMQQELAYDQQLTAYGNSLQAWRQTNEQNLRMNARRAIGGFAESETQGALTQLVFPILFRQEARYIPTGSSNFGARVGHAFTSLVVAREDTGHKTLNLSLLAGTGWAGYIADKEYYPMLNTPHLATSQVFEKTVGFNLGGDVLLNLVHEFAPRRSF